MILIIKEWLAENNVPHYRHAYDIIHIQGNIAIKLDNDALYIRIATTGYNNIDNIIDLKLEYANPEFFDELLKLIKKYRKSNIYLVTRKATINAFWLSINSMISTLAMIWSIIILTIGIIVLIIYFSFKYIRIAGFTAYKFICGP